MKKILFTLILSSSFLIQSDNSRSIDKLTVDELTQIVRAILQESLEKWALTIPGDAARLGDLGKRGLGQMLQH